MRHLNQATRLLADPYKSHPRVRRDPETNAINPTDESGKLILALYCDSKIALDSSHVVAQLPPSLPVSQIDRLVLQPTERHLRS